MPTYIPELYDTVPRYQTTQCGIAYIFGVVAELDKTPLADWTIEHVYQWAIHLCVYADERVKNARYERLRRWKMKNDAAFAHARRARKNSPEGRLRARALRDERLRHSTPPWASTAAMQAVYDEAHRIELLTGVKQPVDHCIPLICKDETGKHIASGLHWEGNLCVCPGLDNLRKGTRCDLTDVSYIVNWTSNRV